MASSLFHLELLIIFYFLPPFLGIKETRRLSRLIGENGAKEALDAGVFRSGDEPGKMPENPAKLSAKGG
jgi:hypothetical protein